MKIARSWHQSPFGQICCFLGSIRTAIPVLVLVTAALIWGTIIESTADGKTAKAVVYGSWWFIALMAMISMSLTFAVVTRYPWRKKHIGFITVHASMILLIIGGFWSLFARVEGNMRLQEGQSAAYIESQLEHLFLLQHDHDQESTETVGALAITSATEKGVLGDFKFTLVDIWKNTAEEQIVLDKGERPLEAVEITLDPTAVQGFWLPQSSPGQQAPSLENMILLVMPAGVAWTAPPPATGSGSEYSFVLESGRIALPQVGQEIANGWTVQSINRFSHARVSSSGGLEESDADHTNPALEVVITDNNGSVERHVAFENFPDSHLEPKTLEGSARSGVALEAPMQAQLQDQLVFSTEQGPLHATYVSASGQVSQFENDGQFPWRLTCGDRNVTILQHFTHAVGTTEIVEAPSADRTRPALRVQIAEISPEPITVLWGSDTPVMVNNQAYQLRYGPSFVEVPFTIRLEDFRKMDYPGTDMAMAYESDVSVTVAGQSPKPFRIYMNNPYEYGGWKVYQSSFIGDDVSIFSVMRDPGLPLTYFGCTFLCIGIFVTYYFGSLSIGHPGIPVAFARKGSRNGSHSSAPRNRTPAHTEHGNQGPGLDTGPGESSDPGAGSDDPSGHAGQNGSGRSDRTVGVVGETRT